MITHCLIIIIVDYTIKDGGDFLQSWEEIWKVMVSSEEAKEEYRKAFLLNMFQKLVARMNVDSKYKNHIMALYRQTSDVKEVTRVIYLREFDYKLEENEIQLLTHWMNAYRRKHSSRKSISTEVKRLLCEKQGNRCEICNQPLGDISSKIHVDHIIPWVLVGDELEDNFQVLCDTCNECKSSKTDYIFKSLIKLT